MQIPIITVFIETSLDRNLSEVDSTNLRAGCNLIEIGWLKIIMLVIENKAM